MEQNKFLDNILLKIAHSILQNGSTVYCSDSKYFCCHCHEYIYCLENGTVVTIQMDDNSSISSIAIVNEVFKKKMTINFFGDNKRLGAGISYETLASRSSFSVGYTSVHEENKLVGETINFLDVLPSNVYLDAIKYEYCDGVIKSITTEVFESEYQNGLEKVYTKKSEMAIVNSKIKKGISIIYRGLDSLILASEHVKSEAKGHVMQKKIK